MTPHKFPYLNHAIVDVIQRPDYRVGYEKVELDGWPFIIVHVDVIKWSSRIARQFEADIDQAHSLLGAPVYVRFDDPANHTFIKFITRFGFKPYGSLRTVDGYEVPLFQREFNLGRRRNFN